VPSFTTLRRFMRSNGLDKRRLLTQRHTLPCICFRGSDPALLTQRAEAIRESASLLADSNSLGR
jgi:hypothetical protein